MNVQGGGRQEEVCECTGVGEDRRRYVNIQGQGRQEEVCECTGAGKTGGGM